MNRALNFTDPSGHCASERFDVECWQQYDALVNQFRQNGFSDEDIVKLIGNGEAYRYREMRVMDIYDRFRNCGSDFDCSNDSRQHTRDPYANPCTWQYWQDCYEPVVTSDEMEPDAIVLPGVSASAAGSAYGVVGEEVLFNRRSGEVSVFGYYGEGIGVGLEADASLYGGVVWNLEENVAYEGPFSTLAVDFSAVVGVQLSFFWTAGTTPFTGQTWGFGFGPSAGGGLGVSGSQTIFTCQLGCQ
jgi:hypothetical protein